MRRRLESALTWYLTLALVQLCSLLQAQELDYPLTITRPQLVTQGQPARLACQLGLSQGVVVEGSACRWDAPGSRSLIADMTTGSVTEEGSADVLSGYTGIDEDQDGRTCGLDVEAIDIRDLGQWSCSINEGLDNMPFRRGTFQLIEEGFLDDIRLPRHIIPSNYILDIVPVIQEGNFTSTGSLHINFQFFEDGADTFHHNKLYLHTKETAINEEETTVFNIFGERRIVGHEYDLEREFYVIHMDRVFIENLFISEYSLNLTFTSILNDKLAGFYRSKYKEEGSEDDHYLAVTQFEPIDARRAFPVMDEPDLKARFDVRIGRDENLVALSNMNLVSTEPLEGMDGYVWDTFAQSEKMSTYLLAFMVSDFGSTPGVGNPKFNIWHVKSKANQALLAADCGPKVLSFYEQYFGVLYPLPKIDMAAIPDFDAGAMENWGLITYRETALLYNEGISSLADRERVIEVIAHELAHQWFGNIVTMKWWTDLWLNEGFATYVENIGKDFYDPELVSRDRVLLVDLHDVFEIDAFETTVAISSEVTNPTYDLVFGRISYGKGNCLIRMIENFITLDTFNKGINLYLTSLAYDNADRTQLWDALNTAAELDGTLQDGLDVTTIMEKWTTQGGYPVITAQHSGGDNFIILSQQRFFLNPEATETNEQWYIPISVAYPGSSFDVTTPQTWLTDADESITFEVESFPYVVNVKETGYYRVNYDTENWMELRNLLTTGREQIHHMNRAQMYDDSINLARASQLGYDLALDISKTLSTETEYIPLEAGLRALRFVNTMFRSTDKYSFFRTFMRDLIEPRYMALGFDNLSNDVYTTILQRVSVIDNACAYGQESCIIRAKELFASWMAELSPDENNPIDVDQKRVVYEIAIREGGQKEFDFLLARLPNVQADADIQKTIYGLGSSSNLDNLNSLLDMTIDPDSNIRSQDGIYVYRGVGSTAVGMRVQFDWFDRRFEDVMVFYGDQFTGKVDDIMNGFFDSANTAEEEAEAEAFLNKHRANLGSAVTVFEQGIDRIIFNTHWMDKNFDTVLTWLQGEVTTTTNPANDAAKTSSNVMLTFEVGIVVFLLSCFIAPSQ